MTDQPKASTTLHEDDLLPFGDKNRPADDPMGTVKGFVGAGFTLEVVGSVGGGAMPAAFSPDAPEMAPAAPAMGLSNTATMGMPSPPRMG